MSKTLTLTVPPGTTEANVGTRLYTADAAGKIAVPAADGAALLAVPGFTAPDYTPPPSGFVRMKAPEGAATCSVAGTTYTVGEDGHVIVPASNALASHGFVALENDTGQVLVPYTPDPFVMAPEATFVPEAKPEDDAPVFVPAAPAETPPPVVAEPVVEPDAPTPEVVAEAAPAAPAVVAPVAEPDAAGAVKE